MASYRIVWDVILGWIDGSFLGLGSFSNYLGCEVVRLLFSRVFFFGGNRFFMFIRSCLHLALKAFCSDSLRSEGSRLLIVKIFLNSLLNVCSSFSLRSNNSSSNRIFLSLSSSIFYLFSSCSILSLRTALSFSLSSSILMYSILGSLFLLQ